MTHKTPSTPSPLARGLSLKMMLLGWSMICLVSACSGKSDENAATPDQGTQGPAEACALGTLDCACINGTSCGLSDSGQQLGCIQGVCALPECTAGELGCACADGACGEGLECSASSGVERCEVTGCEVGSENCGCGLDRACDTGFACIQNSCQAIDCMVGQEGCACSRSFGCATDLECDVNDAQLCIGLSGCSPGNVGCVCDPRGECNSGLLCEDNTCQDPSCPAGLNGCACLDGDCGRTDNGDQLDCVSGVCELSSCPSGEPGCVCKGGIECADGSGCVNGYCKSDVCIPGESGCGCRAGGCDPGLACVQDTCVDNTGRVTGPCKADNTCNRNARCDLASASPTCVWCELGTHRCQCEDTDVPEDQCNPGLSCVNDHCVGDDIVHGREVPDELICHTPCTGDLSLDDGSTVVCPSEGVVEGCYDGKECRDGECLDPEAERKMCYSDADCAFFQFCVQGYCYSECDSDSDCEGDLSCYQKVCRESCSFNEPCQTPNTVCESVNSDQGFCMAETTVSGEGEPLVLGSVGLSHDVVRLTNTTTRSDITLINRSNQFVTLTLTKYSHELVDRNGSTDMRTVEPGQTCQAAQCPLYWLQMGEPGALTQDPTMEVVLPPHCENDASCPVVSVQIPNSAVDAVRWQGRVMVESKLGTAAINISYVERPSGQWSGQMVYFANFDNRGIDTTAQGTGWLDRNRDLVTKSTDGNVAVRNGLLQRWGAFRSGNLGGGWDEMSAVLVSTQNENWRWPNVRDACRTDQFGGACYLYAQNNVVATELPVYVQDQANAPIPTGSISMPFVMNLDVPDPVARPQRMEGKIVSDRTLHYAGDPFVAVELLGDPGSTTTCAPGFGEDCVHFIRTRVDAGGVDGFEADLAIGGRYPVSQSEQCAPGFERQTTPWLVPGFVDAAYIDAASNLYRRDWCVDYRLPTYSEPIGTIEAATRVTNRSLAMASPVPNGQVTPRRLELLDGAMINQRELFILFRERYPSFLGGEDLEGYGYMLLQREPAELDLEDDDNDLVPNAYDGAKMPTNLSGAPQIEGLTCSDEILFELDDLLGPDGRLDNPATDLDGIIEALIDGSTGTQVTQFEALQGNELGCTSTTGSEVHYLCVDTGLFNGGDENTACWGSGARANLDSCATARNNQCEDGGPGSVASSCARGTDVSDCGTRYIDAREPCPETSEVIYFSAPVSQHTAIVDNLCQQDGSCGQKLQTWVQSGAVIDHVDLAWRCETGATCEEDVLDRRVNKIFFMPGSQGAHYTAIRAETVNAFRYKTRFRNREGTSLAFVPSACVDYSNTTPYCYDADAITQIRERTDCLLSIYEQFYADPNSGRFNARLFDYLEESMSVRTDTVDDRGNVISPPRVVDGFERLNAELLIMLGDDAYTSAFESRFDLAGISLAGFEGDLFEDDGIRLGGIAGYEMYKLHQAVQYYSIVLDRFYRMTPIIAEALDAGPASQPRNFMSADAVTYYFDRLIRASTQRSRAWSQIVERYKSFNKPQLARRVAIRAYTQTYLESVALSNVILRVNDEVEGSQRAQLLAQIEESQRRYKMALLDLANVYQSISDEPTFFGYAPDYIPFPALDDNPSTSINAFDQVYQIAISKLEVARLREQDALQQTRAFDTDEASFQAELTRISRTYENQLADVCGTFIGRDGVVYPSIQRYAYLSDELQRFDDPCGLSNTGQIHDQLVQVNLSQVEVQQIITQMQNNAEQVRIERNRVIAECEWREEVAEYRYKADGQSFKLEEDLIRHEENMQIAQRAHELVTGLSQLADCSTAGSCVAAAAAGVTMSASYGVLEGMIQGHWRPKMARARKQRDNLERETAQWVANSECDLAELNSEAQTLTLLLQLRDLEIAMLGAQIRMGQNVAAVERLRQQASRIQAELDEALEMSINVEAAKNNPNVRIYRNDSVINAERTFEDALREAYRLTLVYEYYTSQSYAQLDQLFLTRMVTAGDYNLEGYIYELRNAFTVFEEEYGNPDIRIQTLSLMDDVLRVPLIDANGDPISENQRTAMMREMLLDPARLNGDGYVVLPFATSLEELSPLTRNHKVLYVEANIQGIDQGDQFARLYLRQVGTSTIRSVDDNTQFYRFPDRTAVIDPFFNSAKAKFVNEEIYRSWRLRDRPMVNNNWELVINQRDERANQDLNLNKLADITLYVYYTDFTVY